MKKEKSANWGGFRENSGRKPKVEGTKSTTLSFSCTLVQKDLIKKLKRWIKEYWKEDGSMFFYESQYARLQQILKDKIESGN